VQGRIEEFGKTQKWRDLHALSEETDRESAAYSSFDEHQQRSIPYSAAFFLLRRRTRELCSRAFSN
jgi:hypothetical protein